MILVLNLFYEDASVEFGTEIGWEIRYFRGYFSSGYSLTLTPRIVLDRQEV